MKRKITDTVLLTTLVSAAIMGTGSQADARRVYAVTTENQLIFFDSQTPETVNYRFPVVGLQDDTEIISAIDHRPSTGELMGVSNLHKLYRISIQNVVGLPVYGGTLVGESIGGILSGDKLGMDFNPTVDRIRLTTNEGSNLRVNPDSGALAAQDTTLSPATGIAEIAYDRSRPGAQVTTLFGLDANNNSLVRIGGIDGTPSPNGGVVTQIGPLGIDFDMNSALDYSGADLFSIVKVGGNSSLIRLDPATGAILHNYGAIADNPDIVGMAIEPPALLNAVKLQIKRAFNKSQKDSIKLSAVVNIPAGFQVDGAHIQLDVGGVTRSFILDSNGKAALGHDKVKLKVKSKNGVVLAQQAKFTAKLGGGNYIELEDEGLINTDVKDATQSIFISLEYGDELAQGAQLVVYTAKAGKSGKAKN